MLVPLPSVARREVDDIRILKFLRGSAFDTIAALKSYCR